MTFTGRDKSRPNGNNNKPPVNTPASKGKMASSNFARSAARAAFNRFQRQDFRVLPPVIATRGVDDEDVNDPGPECDIEMETDVDPFEVDRLIESVRRTCGWRHEFDNNRHRCGFRPRHFRDFESELHELDDQMELARDLTDAWEPMPEMVDDPEIATFVEELERLAA